SPATLSSVVPVTDLTDLGFAFKDADDGLRVTDGAVGDFLRQEAEAKGIHVLRKSWDSGVNTIGGIPHPIRTPEDLAGFKVRTNASRLQIDLFKGLGAVPTPLSLGEVYTGLQTHLLDGVSTTIVTMEVARFYEVLKSISLTNHSWSAEWIVVNLDVWKS